MAGAKLAPEMAMTESAGSANDFLIPLLRTLAESLDVREIFARISADARRIVPHDFLMLGLISEDGQSVRAVALSEDMPEFTGMSLPTVLKQAIGRGEFISHHVKIVDEGRKVAGMIHVIGEAEPFPIEFDMIPLYEQLTAKRGIQSYLRVPVRLRGGNLGGLVFCSRSVDGYSVQHAPGARLVADCVALALAHQLLAEEEKKSAEARARAALLETRVQRLTEELEQQNRQRVVGRSKKWKDVLTQATKVSGTGATVVLFGESGTGKEVVARFIHRASPRAEGPFVALNCAALPEQLLESELFGHEKGAFTGALAAHSGKIEQAAGGVLFLDEVGEMSPAVQAKFLRVLQEREYQKVGGTKTLRADIRVLAATNRDLKAAIAKGGFREDLYYRLAVFEITLPALRERPEDILLLVDSSLEELGQSIGRPAAGISEEVRGKLVAYPWPGNVRELRNAIERAVILCEGGLITSEHLPHGIASASTAPASAASAAATVPAPGTLDATEREMIQQALVRSGNNKSKAARILGLTRAQLRSRLEKHSLSVED